MVKAKLLELQVRDCYSFSSHRTHDTRKRVLLNHYLLSFAVPIASLV